MSSSPIPRRRLIITILAIAIMALDHAPSSAATPTRVNVVADHITIGNIIKFLGVVFTAAGAIFVDKKTNAKLACGKANLSGQTKVGPNQSPNGFATVTSSTWGNCQVIGLPMTITPSGTWPMNATALSSPGSSTPVVGQVTTGTLTNMSFRVSASSCTFIISGSNTTSFTNGNPSRFSFTTPSSTLKVSALTLLNGASSCLAGAVTQGDTMDLTGGFTITGTANGGAADPVLIDAD